MSCNQGHLTHPEHWPGDAGDPAAESGLRFDYEPIPHLRDTWGIYAYLLAQIIRVMV